MQIWPEWDLWGQYLLAMDHKKHKLCCLDISECSATAPISPGHYCQLIPLLGSLEGKAALAGNWTLDIPSSGWALDTRYQRGSHSHQGYHNIHVKELFLFLLFARIWYQEPGSETETAADHLFSSAKQISALASAGNGLQRAQHTLAQTLSLAAVMHSFMSASSVPAYSALHWTTLNWSVTRLSQERWCISLLSFQSTSFFILKRK